MKTEATSPVMQKPQTSIEVRSKERTVVWAWNQPILIASTIGFLVIGMLSVLLYNLQSNRIAKQLRQRAQFAEQNGKANEEIRWLKRYLNMAPTDDEARIRLAIAVDDSVASIQDINVARQSLIPAILAAQQLGNSDLTFDLRKRLIQRLIDLGGDWLQRAEQEILELDSPPEDAEVLRLLAITLYGQAKRGSWKPRQADAVNETENYWKFLSMQPVGNVLQKAFLLNPNSMDLADALLDAYVVRLDMFDSRDVRAERTSLRNQAIELHQRLQLLHENSRAQWLAYLFSNELSQNSSESVHSQMTDRALERLRKFASKVPETAIGSKSNRGSISSGVQWQKRSSENLSDQYDPQWDLRLVFMRADSNSANGNRTAAISLFEEILEVTSKVDLPFEIAQSFYQTFGTLLFSSNNHDRAREIWERGCARIPNGDSVALYKLIALAALETSDINDASKAVDRFDAAINDRVKQVNAISTASLPEAVRATITQQLASFSWWLEVAKGHLLLRRNQAMDATTHLKTATASQLNILSQDRVLALNLLSRAYSLQGLWDLAASTLEDALLLAPSDLALHRSTALAWQKSRMPARALSHLQTADDGSFEAALSRAQLLAADINSRASTNRDMTPLRNVLAEARRRLESRKIVGEAPKLAWQLEVLELALSSDLDSVSADRSNPARTTTLAKRIMELSEKYPQVAELQSVASIRFAEMQDIETSNAAFMRLQAIEDVSPLILDETRARLSLVKGDADEAYRILRTLADRIPANRKEILRNAASLFEMANQLALAAELLQSIPKDEHDVDSVMQLGRLTIRMIGQAEKSPSKSNLDSLVQTLTQSIQRLREMEGPSGSRWRFLESTRLLHNASSSPNPKQLIADAAKLQRDIILVRPNWAEGNILAARIAVAQGQLDKAIDYLNSALTQGDTDASNIVLLAKLLNDAKRYAEADQALKRVSSLVDTNSQVAALAVQLALRQGQLERAKVIVNEGGLRQDSDANVWILRAQVAEQEADSLENTLAIGKRAEAIDHLKKALQITNGKDAGIWSYLLTKQFKFGNRKDIIDSLEQINSGPLPDRTKAILVSKGYLSLGDQKQALQTLKNAESVLKSDPDFQLAFADYYGSVSDNDSLIASLENAFRLAPKRDDIRRKLAMTLVVSGNSNTVIPWNRISELIGNTSPDSSDANRLYFNLIQIVKGDQAKIEQATASLRELMHVSDRAIADDAARLLATVLLNQASKGSITNTDQSQKLSLEIANTYEFLVRRNNPSVGDLFRYGEYLLQTKKLTELASVVSQIQSIAPSSPALLSLRLRLSLMSDTDNQGANIVKNWISQNDSSQTANAMVTAGKLLLDLGNHEEALRQFRLAFESDPKQLRIYVSGLAATDKLREAAMVCLEQLQKTKSAEVFGLLADLIAKAGPSSDVLLGVRDQFFVLAKDFDRNPAVLESVANVYLSDEEFEKAIDFYLMAEQIEPNRLLTLNNMAMAFSEIRGKEKEGLQRIERAIQIYGPIPELLDTKGCLQLRNGQITESEKTLREAVKKGADPRFRLHLIQVSIEQNNQSEVLNLWNAVDLKALKSFALTPRERATFALLISAHGEPKPKGE